MQCNLFVNYDIGKKTICGIFPIKREYAYTFLVQGRSTLNRGSIILPKICIKVCLTFGGVTKRERFKTKNDEVWLVFFVENIDFGVTYF